MPENQSANQVPSDTEITTKQPLSNDNNYESIINNLKYKGDKYTDIEFPPQQASLIKDLDDEHAELS